VIDAQGKRIGELDYGPYGEDIKAAGQVTDYRYAGMFYLPETGLYLTHYRLYDPDTKRWLNRDPIGEEGGINLYAYVEGNPVNFVDPTGEFGIGGAIGGAGFSMFSQTALCLAMGGDMVTCLKCINWVDVGISAVAGAIAPTFLKDIVLGYNKTKKYRETLKHYGKAVAGSSTAKILAPSYRIKCEDECTPYQIGKGATSIITSILN
jgi:RHS repeat-associated protein